MTQPAKMSNWFKDWKYLDSANRIALVVLFPAALIVYVKCTVQDHLATRRHP